MLIQILKDFKFIKTAPLIEIVFIFGRTHKKTTINKCKKTGVLAGVLLYIKNYLHTFSNWAALKRKREKTNKIISIRLPILNVFNWEKSSY